MNETTFSICVSLSESAHAGMYSERPVWAPPLRTTFSRSSRVNLLMRSRSLSRATFTPWVAMAGATSPSPLPPSP